MSMLGIKGIRVKEICLRGGTGDLNEFLDEYDGYIIDIKFDERLSFAEVIYKGVEDE